jgi:hypothetical protein
MPDLPVLDAEEQRVLGALLEKERTVPATYPLTLTALRTACNQTSSRDPVVEYDEVTVEAVVKRLRSQDLVRVVWRHGTPDPQVPPAPHRAAGDRRGGARPPHRAAASGRAGPR